MSNNFYDIRIVSCDNQDGKYIVGIVGGSEDCPEEQQAYVRVKNSLGKEIQKALEHRDTLHAGLIIDLGHWLLEALEKDWGHPPKSDSEYRDD